VRRKAFLGVAAGALALAALLVLTRPPPLVNDQRLPVIPVDAEAWLAEKEDAVNRQRAIIPETQKRIRWYRGLRGSRTPLAVVYIHGFSATRQELAPVVERIADGLQANLFETRLSGHGHAQGALVDVRAEDWLADGVEAVAVGSAIGDDVVLMGTSTGATLALAMAGHPVFDEVRVLVLLSPNLGPRDPNADFLTWPGGPQLARMAVGEERSWTPNNELQARYWATRYPMDAVVEMMRLVDFVRHDLPLKLSADLLVFYSPADSVIDTGRLLESLDTIDSQRKKIVVVEHSDDPGNHVLAGNIMSPGNNDLVRDEVVRFVTASTVESARYSP
jgi:esterase/lipase